MIPGLPPGYNPDPFLADLSAMSEADRTAAAYLDKVRREMAACGPECRAVADEMLTRVRVDLAAVRGDWQRIGDELVTRADLARRAVQDAYTGIGAKLLTKAKQTLTTAKLEHQAAGGLLPNRGYRLDLDLAAGVPSPELARWVGGEFGAGVQSFIGQAADTEDPVLCKAGTVYDPVTGNCVLPPPPPPPPPVLPPVTGGVCLCPPNYVWDEARGGCVLCGDWEVFDRRFDHGVQTREGCFWEVEVIEGTELAKRRLCCITPPVNPECLGPPPVPPVVPPVVPPIFPPPIFPPPVCPPVGPPPPTCPPTTVTCPPPEVKVVVNVPPAPVCPPGGSPPPPPPPPPVCEPIPEGPSLIRYFNGPPIPTTRELAQLEVSTSPPAINSGRNEAGRFTWYQYREGKYVQVGDPAKECPPSPPPPPPGIGGTVDVPPGILWTDSPLPELDHPGWCQAAAAWCSDYRNEAERINKAQGAQILWEKVGLDSDPPPFVTGVFRQVWQALSLGTWAFDSVWSGVVQGVVDQADKAQPRVPDAAMHDLWSLSVGGFAQTWLGVPADYLLEPTRHRMQYCYPVHIPAQAELNQMLLTTDLSREDWECYTRAHGNLPNFHYRSLFATRSRLNPSEFIDWMMRQDAPPREIVTALRQYGFLRDSEAKQAVDLKQQLPPFTDIIRMMVRDVENPQTVQDDQLDKGFEEAFQGELKKWATRQGISEEVARKYWRAHFVELAPGQLYEMLHRLRPGVVRDDLAVDDALVKRTLIQADYPPGWIDRLMAISYATINRSDLHSSYNSGSIDDDRVRSGLQDVGYRAEDARTLQRSWKDQRLRSAIRGSGGWTPQRLGAAYLEGSISRETAAVYMADFWDDQQLVNDLLDRIDSRREAQARAKCVKGVKARYLYGEFGEGAARTLLTDLGVDLNTATVLVQGWQCERSSRRRQPTVAMLQKWWNRAIIGTADVVERLGRLGYTPAVIDQMLKLWEMELSEARLKALKAAQREAEAAAKKAAAAAAAAAPCKPPPKPVCGEPPKKGRKGAAEANGVH